VFCSPSNNNYTPWVVWSDGWPYSDESHVLNPSLNRRCFPTDALITGTTKNGQGNCIACGHPWFTTPTKERHKKRTWHLSIGLSLRTTSISSHRIQYTSCQDKLQACCDFQASSTDDNVQYRWRHVNTPLANLSGQNARLKRTSSRSDEPTTTQNHGILSAQTIRPFQLRIQTQPSFRSNSSWDFTWYMHRTKTGRHLKDIQRQNKPAIGNSN
jgi:hypothetical protein